MEGASQADHQQALPGQAHRPRGKAVQVDIRLTPWIESTWVQPVESTALSKFSFQMGQPAPLHRGGPPPAHLQGALRGAQPRDPHALQGGGAAGRNFVPRGK